MLLLAFDVMKGIGSIYRGYSTAINDANVGMYVTKQYVAANDGYFPPTLDNPINSIFLLTKNKEALHYVHCIFILNMRLCYFVEVLSMIVECGQPRQNQRY